MASLEKHASNPRIPFSIKVYGICPEQMWHKMREATPFHTIGSAFLQLLAWAAFTTKARCLHFVFQMLFAGQSSRTITPDCLQFTFYTSTPNIFHFVLASPFLHSWMTIRGKAPAEACLTSYLHVITGGHSTSIPAVPQMQQRWKTCPEVGSLWTFAQAGLWFFIIISCACYDNT